MESVKRGPFQGVRNILRFNWHYYALFLAILCSLGYFRMQANAVWSPVLKIFLVLSVCMVLISLGVSYYIYDYSSFYSLDWVKDLSIQTEDRIANIHAGFDEISEIFMAQYPGIPLFLFDFYDPVRHTEVSIKRARLAYPALPGTQKINTADLVFPQQELDYVFLIFAAHEIRQEEERATFFKTLSSALSPKGRIIVVEHSRDWINFMAFSLGFLHFFSPDSWRRTFENASLRIESRKKINPFVTIYILAPHGFTA